MTPDKWLEKNGKRPYNSESDYTDWYWGSEVDRDPNDPDSDDMLLPPEIFERLPGHITYPHCKCYKSRELALEAFRIAYTRRIKDKKGLDVCPRCQGRDVVVGVFSRMDGNDTEAEQVRYCEDCGGSWKVVFEPKLYYVDDKISRFE